MIDLTIDGIDVSGYIVDGGYEIQRNGEAKDSFENYDGTTVNSSVKYKTTITARLEGVPDETAGQLSAALEIQNPFTAVYSSPAITEEKFLCTSFSADVDDPFPEEGIVWNIKLTLVSQSSETASEDGL